MDNINYTEFNKNSIKNFIGEEYIEDAIDYLIDPENFRSFDKGLIALFKRKGFDVTKKNKYEMSDYLFNKLHDIGSNISRNTVESWFLGEHRPKIEAGYRKHIYEICFAMNLNYDDTIWFFQHVYYDRAFNCHTIEESVYYYAISNHLPYQEALNIIDIINDSPITDTNTHTTSNYTQFLQQRLEIIGSTDELISFLTQNKENFDSWNKSALDTLNSIFQKLIPTEKGKKEIDNLKRTIKRKKNTRSVIPPQYKQSEWGFVMREFFYNLPATDNLNTDIDDYIAGKNIRSHTFVLDRILGTGYTFPKKNNKTNDSDITINIPYIVRNNFPSKKTMSDILSENKIEHSKSYDAIRKMIILLHFYQFWVLKLISNKSDSENEDNLEIEDNLETEYNLPKIYEDNAELILHECGYEGLYAGNPYDWLFLCASRYESPLVYFRGIINELLPDTE